MNCSKKLIIVIVSVLTFLTSYAQETYPDCINPKRITVPLAGFYPLDAHDEIYYEIVDKYTYWYRIDAKSDCKFFYELSPISSDDEYELLIYNYEGTNFCNDLVKKQLKVDDIKSEALLDAKKGETYYIGVVHIDGYGCGHILKIGSKNKLASYKAIQNECIEEAAELIVESNKKAEEVKEVVDIKKVEEVKKVVEKPIVVAPENDKKIEEVKEVVEKPIVVNPKIIKEPIKLIRTINGVVMNRITEENIEAVVKIINTEGGIHQQLISKVDGGFLVENYLDRKLIVSIEKFGYQPLLDTIEIVSNKIEIEITPIKVGDKLIMRKIYFHPNTYVLKDESKVELKKLNQFMLENDHYSFEIEGHTNGNRTVKRTKEYASLGKEWNFKGTSKKLSKLRAEKIKAYLVENGVNPVQLQTIGYGGDRMIVEKPTNMKEAMKNIRVEIMVIN